MKLKNSAAQWENWAVLGIAAVLVAVILVLFILVGAHLMDGSKLPPGLPTLRDGLAAIFAGFGIVCYLLLFLIFIGVNRIKRLERSHHWLIDAVNWNIERLKAHGLCRMPAGSEPSQPSDADSGRWPWGTHHTELLGHLDAAARKFWTLYDPADLSTAPTNEMVAEWLQEHRDVSKDKSRAIASILRPDGLPTGPRR